ncbi:MAG: ASKHA domain-containing protein, partial [Gaiellales bacterium]
EERVLATAAPAGPAFEAAQIRCGMRAAEGAIEGIRIAEDGVELQVIADAEPVGLCGSGLVDCVAELVRSGLLDHSGRFIADEQAAERLPALAPRLTKIGEERVFVMHWRGEDPAESIFLSQRDVRELQFAKASIATGWKILLREYGIEPGDIQQVLLAGSFGAYVGGDIVAGLLATGLTRDRRLRLFIDVGTNSEIALGSADRVVATAAPAGPAFEAAQIRCGMRAAEGAIEGVKIDGDELRLQVIGDAEPVGMCGSGLVDCVAELVQSGVLDHSGRFVTDEVAATEHPALADRLTKIGEERVFVMHWRGEDPANSVFLSQRDVRELQFAKASIATGWRILMNELGVEDSDVTQVLLAGSFGSYLSPASAVRIGLVPRMALPRIVSAGNVAGEGAKMAALSYRERAAADAILEEVEYVEMSGREDFNDLFMNELAFPG